MISIPSDSIWAMIAGDGGAAATETIRCCGSGSVGAAGWLASEIRTVGAPQRWVTPCLRIESHASPASNLRRQTCVPPIAVTAHG